MFVYLCKLVKNFSKQCLCLGVDIIELSVILLIFIFREMVMHPKKIVSCYNNQFFGLYILA